MELNYQKGKTGKYLVSFISTLVFILISHQTYAACSRDDISFYLEKGFTTDQITALCSEVAATAEKTPINEQQSVTISTDENVLFLKRAIKAQKIGLSHSTLIFTQKICIEYGDEDLFGFTAKVCPDITYMISFEGLEVLGTGKKYGFYGTPEVRVKSSLIKREIISELENKKQAERELILDKFNSFEKGEETAIPIRDDFSLEQVKQALETLAN